MKRNKKLIEATLNQAIPLFGNNAFSLPIVWHYMKGKDIAEWQNCEHEDFGEFHYIGLNMDLIHDERDLLGTICHELIHAWQHEKGLDVDHGFAFCDWVIYFSTMGINAASSDCDFDMLENIAAIKQKKAANYFA